MHLLFRFASRAARTCTQRVYRSSGFDAFVIATHREREREEKRSYRGSVGGNHAAHNLHVPAGNEELWPRPELFARRGKTPRLRSTKAKARFRVAFRFIREKSSFYQFPSIHPGSRRRVKERSSSSSHVHQQPRGRQQPFVA